MYTLIGVYNLEPPTRVCIGPTCAQQLFSNSTVFRDRELVEPLTFPITLFTKEFGAVPGYATSWYCRSKYHYYLASSPITFLAPECNTRYYPNYYVHTRATIRSYYREEETSFIQTSQHFYMAAELCELFATMMVTSWYAIFFILSMAMLTSHSQDFGHKLRAHLQL